MCKRDLIQSLLKFIVCSFRSTYEKVGTVAVDLWKAMLENAMKTFKEYLRKTFLEEQQESSGGTHHNNDDCNCQREVEKEEVGPNDNKSKDTQELENDEAEDKDLVNDAVVNEEVVDKEVVNDKVVDKEVADKEEVNDDEVEENEVDEDDNNENLVKSSAKHSAASSTEEESDTEVLIARKRGHPRKTTINTEELRKTVKRKDRKGDENTRNNGLKRSRRIATRKDAKDLGIAARL